MATVGKPASGRSTQSPSKALLLIDRPVLANEIALTLNHGMFTTQAVSHSGQAAPLLREWKPHLIIVDVQLAEGLLTVDELPGMESDVGRIPVIGLTRSGDLETKLLAIDRGVDDILTLPFTPDELLARTFMVMRRAHRLELALSPTIHVGELEIDIVNRWVRVGHSHIHLTSREQKLLYLLAGNAGRVLSRDEIVNVIWGIDCMPDSNVVDQHIHALRVKLQNGCPQGRYIASVPGKGYCFTPESPDPSVS